MTEIAIGYAGYVEENTRGMREVPTEFRRFGNEVKMDWPEEKVNLIMKQYASSFLPSLIEYSDIEIEFKISFQLIDPQILSYFALAVTTSDTTSGDPRYRHLVTPMLPATAFMPKPITVHLELIDTSANVLNAVDVCGCLVKAVHLSHVLGDPNGVMCELTLIGQRITEQNVTTNLLGANSGATADPEGVQGQYYANRLTNANRGSIPANSVADSLSFLLRNATYYRTESDIFHLNPGTANSVNVGGTIQLTTNTATTYGTITAGGTDLTSFYRGFDFVLTYTYSESRPPRSGYNNYGASIQPYVMNSLIKKCDLALAISLQTDSTMHQLQLNTFKKTKTNAVLLKFEKLHDATDWFSLCFAPVSGTVQNTFVDLESQYPFLVIDNQFKYTITPKDLNLVIGNGFSTLRSM